MIRVFIDRNANDGILRVIEAQWEHLPKFGIQPVSNIHEADVICNHGTSLFEERGVPAVHVGHGFYWSRQPWDDGYMDVNRMVVESMRHASAHTAPSEWVNRAIRRGGYWYPETIYHGIDAEKFVPLKQNGGYVLWNKARADYVSNPDDLMNVASIMPKREFHTTIGRHTENVRVLQPMPHAKMKQVIANAGVYLATARETFGIGTLEALAYGIPVAGWDWGGQSEIIIQGATGYLAPPGDFNALAECIERCYAERDALSRNAIEDARTHWKWEPRIEQYANIFKRVNEQPHGNRPKVSVIVTAYKLDQYLPACLDSVTRQTFGDFECLVVDDANLESTRRIVDDYAKRNSNFRYCPTPNNFGLSGSRNYGISLARGKYIRHLDADDFLADNALELEAEALDSDRGVDIVYGHLEVVREDGSRVFKNGEPVRSGWPEEKFKWYHQMAHLNQLPSCVMARRDVYVRSGGYRERMKRQEDAEFWCRVTSLGFRAKKFTQAVTYFHRERADSKGAVEWEKQGAEPDWTAWFPWRMGATEYRSARNVLQKLGENPPNNHLVPFGAQGEPPKGLRFWYVHDHAYPVVSIIVTVGPGHGHYLLDALDSIQAQTYPDWECIVVNDTGEVWGKDIMGAPWAKVVNMDGNRGASEARNEGYKYARGKFIVWMDADDYWLPWFLEKMVGYAENNQGVIFSDLLLEKNEKELKIYRYPDFDSTRVPMTMQYPGSSILYPRKIVESAISTQRGWDVEIPGMEDWDFQILIHHLGHCAYRIPEPLFVYRMWTSTKREADYAKIDAIRAYLDEKWKVYRTGEKKLMCGCQTTKKPASNVPSSAMSSSGHFTRQSVELVSDGTDKMQMVTLEYVGMEVGPFTLRSRVSRDVSYRFGNGEGHKIKSVFLGDAEWMVSMVDGKGRPFYIVLNGSPATDVNDPVAFIGKPITA